MASRLRQALSVILTGNGISFIINKDIMRKPCYSFFEAQVVGIGRRDTGGRSQSR